MTTSQNLSIHMAEVYRAQGNYEPALEYFGKALAIREKNWARSIHIIRVRMKKEASDLSHNSVGVSQNIRNILAWWRSYGALRCDGASSYPELRCAYSGLSTFKSDLETPRIALPFDKLRDRFDKLRAGM